MVTKSSADYGRKIVTINSDTAYIDLDFVKEYSDFKYKHVKDPHRIIITSQWGKYQTATAKKNASLRVRGGIKSPILKKVSSKEEVTVIEQGDNWDKVMTDDGIIGYMQKRMLSSVKEKTRKSDFTPDTFAHIKKDYNICMAWHQIKPGRREYIDSSGIGKDRGNRVICRLVCDLMPGHTDIVIFLYMCKGIRSEVWALVSNLENKNVDTTEVLTHTSKRQNLVNQIVSMAIQYNLDGINVDFESMNGEKVGDAFIEFIRELSIKCKNNGVVLSVDNYVPMSHTSFYNRKEQANFADYVVIMGYDEHYAGSPEAGSVASLSWVTQGVSDTLKEVPADQVILGMPFYTRVWEIPSESSSDDTVILPCFGCTMCGEKIVCSFHAINF